MKKANQQLTGAETLEIQLIKLTDITPSPTNPRKFFDEKKLAELASSIETMDIIQPVTVRPAKSNSKVPYELVVGERRWRASKLAGKVTIKSIVKELTDQEVEDMQFAENVERDDVHPMDEAVAFRARLDSENNTDTIEDIAARINKAPTFVVQRLSLLNLIDPLQKDFWAGKFNMSQAVILARLTQADQKEFLREGGQLKNWDGQYKTAKDLWAYIQRNVMNNLNSVAFKKDDAELVPNVGPCTTCEKRSGCSPLLFPEIKEKDRCFDRACFKKKTNAYLVNVITEAFENADDIVYLKESAYDLEPEIEKVLKSYNLKVLKEYTDFRTIEGKSAKKTDAVTGMWVSGHKTGSRVKIILEKKAASKAGNGATISATASVNEEIERKTERLNRSEELDYEKVMAKVREKVNAPEIGKSKKALELPLTAEVNGIAFYILLDSLSYDDRSFLKAIGLNDEITQKSKPNYRDYLLKLKQLTDKEKATIILKAFLHKYGMIQTNSQNLESFLLRQLAAWARIDIAAIEAEQKIVADKRRENYNKAVAKLREKAPASVGKKKSIKDLVQ